MHQRVELFQINLANHRLTILRPNSCSPAYQGAIDGRVCVSSASREGVMQALLRRVAHLRTQMAA
jgi:hypothetical protein